MITRLLSCALLALAIGGCVSGTRSDASRPVRDMSVLEGAELLGQGGVSLYDQIRRVRPNWLTVRTVVTPTQSSEGIVVYRDGVRMGGIALLRDVMVESVESVRFLNGPEAASRYGLDHQFGAIVVTSRRR